MGMYLVGFEVKTGEIPKDDGTKFSYSNRVLHCTTSDSLPSNFFGHSTFTVKVRMQDMAESLHCRPLDNEVNMALKGIIKKPIELKYFPKDGELKVVGITVLNK